MKQFVGIQRVSFGDAKENFSGFVSKVVRDHAPRIVERSRGQESILVLPVADLVAGFAKCEFDARVTFGESVVATLPQFGLVANGQTFELAMDHLVDELAEYAEDFFSDFDFYRHTDRVAHLPWLLRFVLTPPETRLSLLLHEPETSGTEAVLAAAV